MGRSFSNVLTHIFLYVCTKAAFEENLYLNEDSLNMSKIKFKAMDNI
jgi:hypothetical protein